MRYVIFHVEDPDDVVFAEDMEPFRQDADAGRAGGFLLLLPDVVNRGVEVDCVFGVRRGGFSRFAQVCVFRQHFCYGNAANPFLIRVFLVGPAGKPPIEDTAVPRFLRVLVNAGQPFLLVMGWLIAWMVFTAFKESGKPTQEE